MFVIIPVVCGLESGTGFAASRRVDRELVSHPELGWRPEILSGSRSLNKTSHYITNNKAINLRTHFNDNNNKSWINGNTIYYSFPGLNRWRKWVTDPPPNTQREWCLSDMQSVHYIAHYNLFRESVRGGGGNKLFMVRIIMNIIITVYTGAPWYDGGLMFGIWIWHKVHVHILRCVNIMLTNVWSFSQKGMARPRNTRCPEKINKNRHKDLGEEKVIIMMKDLAHGNSGRWGKPAVFSREKEEFGGGEISYIHFRRKNSTALLCKRP